MPLSEQVKRQARIAAIKWNSEHPVDYIWRKTFNVAFGSEEHSKVDLIDQQIWYEEFKLMEEVEKDPDAKYDSEGRVIIQSKKGGVMSQTDIDLEFENMDISALNEEYGG